MQYRGKLTRRKMPSLVITQKDKDNRNYLIPHRSGNLQSKLNINKIYRVSVLASQEVQLYLIKIKITKLYSGLALPWPYPGLTLALPWPYPTLTLALAWPYPGLTLALPYPPIIKLILKFKINREYFLQVREVYDIELININIL